MQSVGEDSLVHGTRGPANKKDCEVRLLGTLSYYFVSP